MGGKYPVKHLDEFERIRYFYYFEPPSTHNVRDVWNEWETSSLPTTTPLSASEETTLLIYDVFVPLLGAFIIILNLAVVISSVILLRKGQQPYTTYLFLGNLAVSDLLTGFAVIYGQYAPQEIRGEDNCAFLIGIIVSSSLVSVYSVGLIAVDRFLYIVYGLQYQRYLSTIRARILIIFTWFIGIAFGFLPAFGWRGDTDEGRTCWFVRLAPPALIIVIACVGVIPLIVVAVLYGIILQKALRRVAQLRKATLQQQGVQTGNLRLFRGGAASASTNNLDSDQPLAEPEVPPKSKCCFTCRCSRTTKQRKDAAASGSKIPTKWNAIKIVMFTTLSFVVTWLPYFIASVMYVACDPATNGDLCRSLQFAIASPLAILGFTNSLLNPIIYAWWHRGFRTSVKKLYAKICPQCCRCCRGDKSSTKEPAARISSSTDAISANQSTNTTTTAAAASNGGNRNSELGAASDPEHITTASSTITTTTTLDGSDIGQPPHTRL